MNIRVLHNNILVKITEVPNVSSGGIVLTSTEISCTGKVLAVGPGKALKNGEYEHHGIFVGEEVLFGTGAMQNLVEDTQDMFIMNAEMIYGRKV